MLCINHTHISNTTFTNIITTSCSCHFDNSLSVIFILSSLLHVFHVTAPESFEEVSGIYMHTMRSVGGVLKSIICCVGGIGDSNIISS